ncbi:hypothetical protein ACE1TI_03010 [Alteribacillus sp. JSM 102045]
MEFLIFAAIFAVFDALGRINKNQLQETREIKKLQEVIKDKNGGV